MKTFTQKKQSLGELKDRLAKSKITIFTSFARDGEKGMDMVELSELKKALNALDSEYVVEKKTILNKALAETKKQVDVSEYAGSLGTVFGYGDEIATAKSVYTFAKKHPALKYFSALLGNEVLTEARLTEFAKLPSREVLIARLLGMLSYPVRSLAVVLNQIAEKKQTS